MESSTVDYFDRAYDRPHFYQVLRNQGKAGVGFVVDRGLDLSHTVCVRVGPYPGWFPVWVSFLVAYCPGPVLSGMGPGYFFLA